VRVSVPVAKLPAGIEKVYAPLVRVAVEEV
jgi:hypothetical protein